MTMPYYRSPVEEMEAMLSFFKRMEDEKKKDIDEGKRREKEKELRKPKMFTFGEMVIVLIATSIPFGMGISWFFVMLAQTWLNAMQGMLK